VTGFRVHDEGTCVHAEDHDRELPDGQYQVFNNKLDDTLYYGDSLSEAKRVLKAAREVFGPGYGFLTKGDQRLAEDDLLGCNDCGQPLYYCQNNGWYHHVDPDRQCFMVGAEKHNYYAEDANANRHA
jgi:hypothetical protein